MFVVILVQLMVGGGHVVNTMGIASDVARRQPHSKLPDPPLLRSLLPFFLDVS